MKGAGILLLFGLCTAIGLRLAAKKCEGIAAIQSLRRDLSAFREAFDAGEGSLVRIAENGQGAFFTRLRAYLDALEQGQTERDAAQLAAKSFSIESLHAAALLFFGGLSACPRAEIKARLERFSDALDMAEREAEPKLKQAKLIRAVGVLTGAALAVLLI